MPEFDFHDSVPVRVLHRRIALALGALAAALAAATVAGLVDITAVLIVAGVVSVAVGLLLGGAVLVERTAEQALEQRLHVQVTAQAVREDESAHEALSRILAPDAALAIGAPAHAPYEMIATTESDVRLHVRLTAAIDAMNADAHRASAWLN